MLSGGQQQRVALARALASDPGILLLDEPFAALDTPMRMGLQDELRRLQSNLKLPTIFVTHDLDEAAVVAHRMAVLVAGQLHQVGSVREIIERPADLQVAELVQARNVLPGRVRARPDRTCLELAFGEFPIGRTTFPDGAPVRAVIRPESIGVVDGHDDHPLGREVVRISGPVVDTRDEATRSIARVNIRGTLLDVSVSEPSTDGRRVLPGDTLHLIINPERIHLIAEPPAGIR